MTAECFKFAGIGNKPIPMGKRRLLMEYIRNDLTDRDIVVTRGKCSRKGTLLGELRRLSKPGRKNGNGKM